MQLQAAEGTPKICTHMLIILLHLHIYISSALACSFFFQSQALCRPCNPQCFRTSCLCTSSSCTSSCTTSCTASALYLHELFVHALHHPAIHHVYMQPLQLQTAENKLQNLPDPHACFSSRPRPCADHATHSDFARAVCACTASCFHATTAFADSRG